MLYFFMGALPLRSSFSLSVFFHAFLLLAWFVFLSQRAMVSPSPRMILIEIDPLPKKQTEAEENSKRVVQTLQTEKKEKSLPNAFLGAQNQVVDQQTISAKKIVAMGHQASRPQDKTESTREALSKFGVPLLSNINQKIRPEEAFQERLAPQWTQQNDSPRDYIKGLKESERTALNTKEYMFYGYFQRIRERLDWAWSGVLRQKLTKLYRGGRQLASDMDHTTRLLVTLNFQGEVVRVQVVEESGTRDLDDAAINAFNQAGPFPNPPQGIVDKSGLIQIRWDFILKT